MVHCGTVCGADRDEESGGHEREAQTANKSAHVLLSRCNSGHTVNDFERMHKGTYMKKSTRHYCKHCEHDFMIELHEHESGDFFLVCPYCEWKHYRRFENGDAVHCEFTKRTGDPVILK